MGMSMKDERKEARIKTEEAGLGSGRYGRGGHIYRILTVSCETIGADPV